LWSSLNVSTHESDEWGTVWVSVLRDITLQREIQASLRASEQRYRRLVDTFSVVTWHCPPDGLHITPQPTWMAFTGQTAEEMLGAGWTKVVHPDDATAAALQWQSAVERGEPFENVHRIRRHDGSWRWMSVRAVPIRDNEGSIVEWMGMGQDITERMRAETALAESEERLENALAGSGLALWDWDISRHEVTGDHRWQDILGYPIGELGKAEETWMQLIHPDDLGRFNANLAAHLQGETDRFQNEHRLRHKLGHWVAVEAAGRVTRRDQDAQPTRMSGTVLDISQKRRLNEEGVQLLKRIEALIHETTSGPPQRDRQADLVASLTRRQREILCLIAAGKTSAEIGRQLNLSTNTVVSHRRNLMAKLDLHTTADVTRFALANRMLDRG
jgi:PAS domain S-box-containing protein